MMVPTLEGVPVVTGGYIPFSLTRSDAFNGEKDEEGKENQSKNIWPSLIKTLPRVYTTPSVFYISAAFPYQLFHVLHIYIYLCVLVALVSA